MICGAALSDISTVCRGIQRRKIMYDDRGDININIIVIGK